MGLLQRMILAFVSRERAAKMEAESRSWMIRCTSCGHATSVWDAGGIRAGASGNPSYRKRCAACGDKTTHRMEQSAAQS